MVVQKKIKIAKPVVLIVLDGWGIAQPFSGNAVSLANTPNINDFIKRYPTLTLGASGEAVGLPWGEAGNSEVGHMNLGLGRIFYQDLPRINKSINDKSFYENKVLLAALDRVKKNKSKLHLLGLVSNGGVHSSIEHLQALLDLAKKQKINQVFVQAILDGRDTPYNSGRQFIKELEKNMASNGLGEIATISGRFYAMDRDNHWDRIAKAYQAMAAGQGNFCESADQIINESYNKKIFDEEFTPAVITQKQKPVGKIENGDSLIFFNFRPDRARQLTKAFVLPGFDKFERKYINDLTFVCFCEYEKNLPVEIVFPPESYSNTLGEIISQAGLKQLRIAETEKYAHVTYFFNGGKEEKLPGEDQILVASPQVPSYDLKPEMSAGEVTDKLIKAITEDKYDFILVNYANPDMVAHTGNLKAGIEAVEIIDKYVGKVVKAILAKDGLALICADHGNVEGMFNMQTGMIDKEHSANPVPFIIIGQQFEGRSLIKQDVPGSDLSLLAPQGILSDVAPTILKIMGLAKPKEMTGRSLI